MDYTRNDQHREGPVARAIEEQTAKLSLGHIPMGCCWSNGRFFNPPIDRERT